jgi:phosphoglycolate phosphatase
MTNKLDTVLFDFDGTLLNINIDFAKMKQDVLSLGIKYGVSPNPELYVLESIDDIFNQLSQEDVSLSERFRKQAKQILVDIEMDALPNSKAFDKADETLKQLKDRGIKVGIVTRNCRTAVLKSSEKAGFVYDILLTRDDVKKVKPDPQHLWDALNLLDSKPENSIMVGDHPIDVVAGKRAGMKTAAVLTLKTREDFQSVAPDLILNDVSGILDIL